MHIEYLKSAKYLVAAAHKLGLQARLLNEHGLVQIEIGGQLHYLYNSVTTLNTQLAGALSGNKLTTREILASIGEPTPAYSLVPSEARLRDFLDEHDDIIVKTYRTRPTKLVRRLRTGDAILPFKYPYRELIAEAFLPGRELRSIVLDGQVLAVQERRGSSADDLINKIYCIALAPDAWPAGIIQRAPGAITAMGLRYGAVDFIESSEGELTVLEINSSPGIWHICDPDEGQGTDLARILLRTQFNLS